jgi:hypothetical protein
MSVSDESPDALRMHPEPDALAPASETMGAPLGCPSCGYCFDAVWQGLNPEDQQCPACGEMIRAAWPEWDLAPRTVVIQSVLE